MSGNIGNKTPNQNSAVYVSIDLMQPDVRHRVTIIKEFD